MPFLSLAASWSRLPPGAAFYVTPKLPGVILVPQDAQKAWMPAFDKATCGGLPRQDSRGVAHAQVGQPLHLRLSGQLIRLFRESGAPVLHISVPWPCPVSRRKQQPNKNVGESSAPLGRASKTWPLSNSWPQPFFSCAASCETSGLNWSVRHYHPSLQVRMHAMSTGDVA